MNLHWGGFVPGSKHHKGTDSAPTPVATVLDSGTRAEHPVDAGVMITSQDVAWSANPIVSLRPLASDLGTVRRGRCRVT